MPVLLCAKSKTPAGQTFCRGERERSGAGVESGPDVAEERTEERPIFCLQAPTQEPCAPRVADVGHNHVITNERDGPGKLETLPPDDDGRPGRESFTDRLPHMAAKHVRSEHHGRRLGEKRRGLIVPAVVDGDGLEVWLARLPRQLAERWCLRKLVLSSKELLEPPAPNAGKECENQKKNLHESPVNPCVVTK